MQENVKKLISIQKIISKFKKVQHRIFFMSIGNAQSKTAKNISITFLEIVKFFHIKLKRFDLFKDYFFKKS